VVKVVADVRGCSICGKESGHGRYVTMWRRDGGRWLAIMDTGYPDPPVTR
jgi:hypothetical protein